MRSAAADRAGLAGAVTATATAGGQGPWQGRPFFDDAGHFVAAAMHGAASFGGQGFANTARIEINRVGCLPDLGIQYLWNTLLIM